jgi:hypothetical protein
MCGHDMSGGHFGQHIDHNSNQYEMATKNTNSQLPSSEFTPLDEVE